ncbi:hypothetical protein MUK42_18343 [Musa troglodytarum]|uniref:Uncharacterized protein n=1 Tax=Musa troglodytarum TaxID=320322 RepID=A0A9E7FA51_9LILI|nr:hypothetical protein MUK42_18343 [Musa troglodytarum]
MPDTTFKKSEEEEESILSVLNSQPIQHARIFLSRTMKERLLQLPESAGDPHPLDIEQLGKLVEPPMEAVAEFHDVLDVVHSREVDVDEIEEAGLGVREVLASEKLEKELAKALGINPRLIVLLEIDAALAEKVDGVGREDVLLDVELAEIELPYAATVGAAGGEGAELVGEGETELDEFEHVDIGLEGGVVELGAGPEVAEGAAHDAGELGVHGHVREVVHDLADQGELRLEVVAPHLADLDRLVLGQDRRHRTNIKRNQEP